MCIDLETAEKYLNRSANGVSKTSSTARFPAKQKMTFSTPGQVVLGLPSPFPRVGTDGRTDGWMDADVTTKIFLDG